MRMRRFRALALYVLAILPVMSGCKSLGAGSGVSASASAGVAADSTAYTNVVQFRNIFHKIAQRRGFADNDIQKMIYLPVPEMMTPPSALLTAQTPTDAMNALAAFGQNFTPAQVYQHGVLTPFDAATDVDSGFAAQGPVTFVIIPGIFGEFINDGPFQEVYTNASSFNSTYQSQIANVQDTAFDIAAMGQINVNLGDRVILGGIDDSNHNPRVQAIFLKAQPGSFESINTIGSSAQTNLRRLAKLFQTIPLANCQNIYLIGYSRGTPVVLEMLTEALADPTSYPFVNNIKGIVTLAGVSYGTELADDAFYNTQSASYQTINKLKETLDGLRVNTAGDGFLTKDGTLLKDWQAIFLFAIQAAGLQNTMSQPAGMSQEDIVLSIPDPMWMVGFVNKAMFHFFVAGLSVQDRLNNIERGKQLMKAIIVGANDLTSASRIKWWQEHTIPSSTTIYSIAGSMPEVSTDTTVSIMLNNPYYGASTADYAATLRKGYYDLFALSKVAINDSQVIEPKERIWPSLHQLLNSQQPPFKSYYMGVLGTHHWGLAFPAAIKQANGQVNPFPRPVLLEAMAAFIQANKSPI